MFLRSEYDKLGSVWREKSKNRDRNLLARRQLAWRQWVLAGWILCSLLFGASWCLAQTSAATPEEAQAELAAQRLLFEARRLAQDGDLAAAVREYGLLAQRFAGRLEARQALLERAQLQLRLGNPQDGRDTAQQLIDAYPSSSEAAGAFVILGRSRSDQPSTPADLEEARSNFRRVPLLFGRDAFPELDWRGEARVRSGDIGLRLGETEAAAAAFVRAIEDEAPSRWTARARLGLAEVLLRQGEWTAAADVLQRLIRTSELGLPEGDVELAVMARRQLTLIHRLRIRPQAGQPRWQTARQVAVGLALDKPVGIAVHEDGRLAIADDGASTAFVSVGPEGAGSTGAGFTVVSRMPADDPGKPWWSGDQAYLPTKSRVQSLLDRAAQSFIVMKGSDRKPAEELTAGSRGLFGQWYLVESDVERLLGYPPVGGRPGTLASGDPIDVATDRRGRVYLLDGDAGTVTRFDVQGTSEGVVVRGNWRRPQALEVDFLGNIYVLDRGESQIHLYSPDGERLQTLGPQLPGGIELRTPMDLSVDGSGRLWLVDSRLAAVVVLE